jgi:uncharacterized protein (DUF4415 family)
MYPRDWYVPMIKIAAIDPTKDRDGNPVGRAPKVPRPAVSPPVEHIPQETGKRVPVTIKMEPDVLAAWKSLGAGYQTRINELLRREMPK